MLKKILLTDDDRDLIEAMQLKFERAGYTVVLAFDGEQCIETAKREVPDIIIMDVSMPNMDGYSAVKAIKADKALQNIPVIILTGKDQMEDLFKIEGIKAYLVKPFEFALLAEKVEEILQR